MKNLLAATIIALGDWKFIQFLSFLAPTEAPLQPSLGKRICKCSVFCK